MAQAFDGKKKVLYQPTRPKSIRPYIEDLKISTFTPYSQEITKHLNSSHVSGLTTDDSIYSPSLMASKGNKVRVALDTSSKSRSQYKIQRDRTKFTIGYADELEIKYSDDDRLVYAPYQHFVNRILYNKHYIPYLGDIIFIYNTPEANLLLSLIKNMYKPNEPKIVLFSSSFYQPDFPVLNIPSPFINNKEIISNQTIVDIVRSEFTNGVIYRQGVSEVNKTISELNSAFTERDLIEFYPVYDQLSQVELEKIFNQTEKVKIIVGINLEPISNVGFVIDDLMRKVPEITSNGGIRLVLKQISLEESKRRNYGERNYKLISQAEHNKLSSVPNEPILYHDILKLISARLKPDKFIKYPINVYKSVLTKLGLINPNITLAGKFISEIPLRLGNAIMVYLGYRKFLNVMNKNTDLVQNKILLRTIIAVASMNEIYVQGFFLPLRQRTGQSEIEYTAEKKEYTDKYHKRFIGITEIHTLVNIFWQMLSDIDVAKKYDQASRYLFVDYLSEWATNNKMNYQKLKEFFILMQRIESIVEAMIHLEVDPRTVSPQLRQTEILPRGDSGQWGYSLNWELPAGGYVDLGNKVANVFTRAYILNIYQYQGNGLYFNSETNLSFQVKDLNEYPPIISIDHVSGIMIPA
jgi:hypothetical protein